MNEIFLKMAGIICRVIYYTISPILTLVYFFIKPSRVPPIKNPILKLSATTLAMKIRNGELSSEAVVQACIERIKEVNPFLNSVVEDRFEEALNDARLYDTKLKTGEVNISMLEKEKPLYGVPVTVKESCSVKGLSLTGGMKKRKGVKASKDGSAVALLKDAGAIPLLVSNIPELSCGLHTTNCLFGSTKNPYDTRKTPGGSSGGEATLITTGASPLGIGSDFIGSVRIPSHFNGIFGHKVTPGVVPIEGHFLQPSCEISRSMLSIGPLTKYVDDLYLAMKVLSSNSEISLRLDESVDMEDLKVFYIDDCKNFSSVRTPSQSIKDAIRKAIMCLSDKGAQLNKLPQDWFKDIIFMTMTILGNIEIEVPNMLNIGSSKSKNTILEVLKSSIGLSDHILGPCLAQLVMDKKGLISKERIEYHLKNRLELRQKFNKLLKDNAVLICPTFPIAATFPQLMTSMLDCAYYCAIANIMGLPSTHVTMGLNSDGLPIGLQVISAQYQDHVCLAVAKELETRFGGWIPPS